MTLEDFLRRECFSNRIDKLRPSYSANQTRKSLLEELLFSSNSTHTRELTRTISISGIKASLKIVQTVFSLSRGSSGSTNNSFHGVTPQSLHHLSSGCSTKTRQVRSKYVDSKLRESLSACWNQILLLSQNNSCDISSPDHAVGSGTRLISTLLSVGYAFPNSGRTLDSSDSVH